jgi:hypothetical protein
MPDRISLLLNPDSVCVDRGDRRAKIAVVNPGRIVSSDWRLPFVSGDTIITAQRRRTYRISRRNSIQRDRQWRWDDRSRWHDRDPGVTRFASSHRLRRYPRWHYDGRSRHQEVHVLGRPRALAAVRRHFRIARLDAGAAVRRNRGAKRGDVPVGVDEGGGGVARLFIALLTGLKTDGGKAVIVVQSAGRTQ